MSSVNSVNSSAHCELQCTLCDSQSAATLRSNTPVRNHLNQQKESAVGRKRSLSQSQSGAVSGAVRTTFSDPSSPPPYSLLSAVRLFHTVAKREVTRPGQWAITAFPQPMHHSKGGSLETGRIVSFPEEQIQKF